MTAIETILNLLDNKLREKLIKIAYEWTDLVEIIEPHKIWIPSVSKRFVPITYPLQQVSVNGKKTERLVKITHNSILCIDPKSLAVHSEIMFKKVQEFRSTVGSHEILIKFIPETEQGRDELLKYEY